MSRDVGRQMNSNEVRDDGSYGPKDSSSSETRISDLEKDVKKLKSDLEKNKDALEKNKFDIMLVLGIFVALVTYLSLEIQVFKSISDPLLVIAISIFFIASVLLFVLTLDVIVSSETKCRIKNVLLFVVLIVLFFGSIFFIYKAKTNKIESSLEMKSSVRMKYEI